MPYSRSQMVYTDYKWTASADKDNPYYRGGNDHAELNRTEGYEVQYFIEHFVEKLNRSISLEMYQKTEKMIRLFLPRNIRKREQIQAWLVVNWSNVGI